MGLLRAIAVVFAAALVCWAAMEAAPGSVEERAARVAGLLPGAEVAVAPAVRARALAAAAEARGVAGSPAKRLGKLLRGDLGRAWRDGRPVGEHLARAAPATFRLVGLAALFMVILGVGAGLLAARGPGDRAIGLATALALAVPLTWLCVLAQRADERWILPPLLLSLAAAAALARLVRAELLELKNAGFVQAARARGASQGRALAVHALAASAAPLVAFAPALAGWLFGAAPVVERGFAIPGLGALLLDAAAAGDAPLVTGVVLSVTAFVVGLSVAALHLARWLDPRVP